MARYLRRVAEVTGGSAWRLLPTVFWLDSSDAFLKLVCFLGSVAAGLVFVGKGWRIALAFCYLLYLSLVHAGQDFMSLPVGHAAARDRLPGDLSWLASRS